MKVNINWFKIKKKKIHTYIVLNSTYFGFENAFFLKKCMLQKFD